MKHYITLIAFVAVWGAQAQQNRLITMEEAVSQVLENGASVKIMGATVEEAKADYRQSMAVFLPNITASYTGITTTNPLMAFGSKLNQEILTQNDFNPALLNDPDRVDNFATKIEVQQPLVNLDGFLQRKAAKAKYQASELQWERTKEHVTLETQKAYMQLQLAHKTVAVLEQTKKAMDETLRITLNSYDQGLLQKSDLLAVQVRASEISNQLQYAKSNVQNASNFLSVLLGDNTFTTWQPADTLQLMSVKNDLARLSEDRADIQAMSFASKAYENMYKADRFNFLPRLNAFGSYELYDDEIFQADASGYLVGAQLSWNLFEGGKKIGKASKSKASFEKSQLELNQYKMKSEMEIRQANLGLQDAMNALQLAELAKDQSKESLRIRTNRYKEGLERTSDLLFAEAQYAQKQLEYYNAIYRYNYAQLYLQFLSK